MEEAEILKTLKTQGCWVKDLVGQPFIMAYHVKSGMIYIIEKVNGTIIDTIDVSAQEFTMDDFLAMSALKFYSNLQFQESRQASEAEKADLKIMLTDPSLWLLKK